VNLIKLFLFLGIGFVYLEANYCVQVLSTPADTKDFIVNEAKSISYEPFSNVRVEQRGSYYVLRVGDYKRYQDGQKDAYKIRRFKRDAFLRRCTLDPEKVIYSRDQRSFKENIIQDIQEDITFEGLYFLTKDSFQLYYYFLKLNLRQFVKYFLLIYNFVQV
jgi:hypothetical protein